MIYRIKQIIKNYWIIIIDVIMLVYLIENSSKIGWLLFFLLNLLVSILWVAYQWKSIKLAIQQIETMIWGKPLDKQFWKKGELKNTHIKFVLNKGDKNE